MFMTSDVRGTHRRAWTAAVVAAGVGLAAGACSTDETPGTAGESGATESVSIIASGSHQAGLEELITAYTAEHPEIDFSVTYAPTDELQTSVRTQLAAGNAPDIVAVYPGNGSAMSMAQLSDAGLLEDLSAQEWTSVIPDGFTSAFTSEGGVYVYSPGASVLGVIYSKSVFADNGIEVPTTVTEFEQAATTLEKAGVTPIALGTNTPWITQLIPYALVPGMVFADDPAFAQGMLDGEGTFATSGWLDAFERYADWQDAGFFNDNPNGTTSDQMTQMVGDGTAAMAVMVSPKLAEFADVLGEDLGYFPLPSTDDAAKNWIPGGVVVGLGVTTQAKNKQGALDFVEFLGQPENMELLANAMSSIPFVESSELDPLLEQFTPYFDEGRAVPFPDQMWPNAEVQPAMFAAIQEMLGGQATPEEAVAQMDEAFQE